MCITHECHEQCITRFGDTYEHISRGEKKKLTRFRGAPCFRLALTPVLYRTRIRKKQCKP